MLHTLFSAPPLHKTILGNKHHSHFTGQGTQCQRFYTNSHRAGREASEYSGSKTGTLSVYSLKKKVSNSAYMILDNVFLVDSLSRIAVHHLEDCASSYHTQRWTQISWGIFQTQIARLCPQSFWFSISQMEPKNLNF